MSIKLIPFVIANYIGWSYPILLRKFQKLVKFIAINLFSSIINQEKMILPLPPLLLMGVDFLQYPEKNNFLRLAQEEEILKKALIIWNYTPEFPRSSLPPSCHGRSAAVAVIGLKYNPASDQLRLCFPLQSVSLLCVGPTWPHGYMAMERTQTGVKPKEPETQESHKPRSKRD